MSGNNPYRSTSQYRNVGEMDARDPMTMVGIAPGTRGVGTPGGGSVGAGGGMVKFGGSARGQAAGLSGGGSWQPPGGRDLRAGESPWNWSGAASSAPAPGSGGGGGGGPVTGSTPLNPMQSESYDAAKGYADSLMNSTNEMTQRELGRYRDEISVGMAREGEAAMGRGADPTLFRTRALAEGQRGMNDLQARLADVNLGRQAEGIGLQTNAANAAAGEQRLMHLGTMSQGLAEQRALLEQQEMQARLNDRPYERLMEMMKSVGSGVFGGYGSGVLGGSGAPASPPPRVTQAGAFGRR